MLSGKGGSGVRRPSGSLAIGASVYFRTETSARCPGQGFAVVPPSRFERETSRSTECTQRNQDLSQTKVQTPFQTPSRGSCSPHGSDLNGRRQGRDPGNQASSRRHTRGDRPRPVAGHPGPAQCGPMSGRDLGPTALSMAGAGAALGIALTVATRGIAALLHRWQPEDEVSIALLLTGVEAAAAAILGAVCGFAYWLFTHRRPRQRDPAVPPPAVRPFTTVVSGSGARVRVGRRPIHSVDRGPSRRPRSIAAEPQDVALLHRPHHVGPAVGRPGHPMAQHPGADPDPNASAPLGLGQAEEPLPGGAVGIDCE